jgi:hypothetical protein
MTILQGNGDDPDALASVRSWKAMQLQMVNAGRWERAGNMPARGFAVWGLRKGPQDQQGACAAGKGAFARGSAIYRLEQIRGQTSWSSLTPGDRFANADDISPPMTGLAATAPRGAFSGGSIRLMRRHFLFRPLLIFE